MENIGRITNLSVRGQGSIRGFFKHDRKFLEVYPHAGFGCWAMEIYKGSDSPSAVLPPIWHSRIIKLYSAHNFLEAVALTAGILRVSIVPDLDTHLPPW